MENAVKFGVAPYAAGGEVNIRSQNENGKLILTVTNRGPLAVPAPGATAVGLANARERLRLLFDQHASLELREDGGLVTTRIVIPQKNL